MPAHLNPLLTRLRASPTLAINEEIRALRAAGQDIVHFGFGQSPFPVAPPIVEEAARHAGNKDYLPAQGLGALREAAAQYFSPRLGREVDPDLVFVGPGSKTNLFHVMFCHAGPLVMPAGSWVSYGPQAQLLGKPAHVLPPRPDRDFKLTPEDLAPCLAGFPPGHQALVLLNSPNNPTGALYQDDELEALAAVCRAHGALVLADEIYGAVAFDGVYRSMARWYPEGTLVSSGLSKAFSAGGFRLGVLVLPDELRDLRGPLINLATETFSCVTSSVQFAACKAYGGDPEVEAHVEDCTAIHRAVCGWVAARLDAGGVAAGAPGGAFYLFPDFESRRQAAALEGSEDLALKLLRDQGVATLPGSAFLVPDDQLRVRISPVDYDGAAALEVFRRVGREVDPDGFVAEAAPRVVAGVERLLGLGE